MLFECCCYCLEETPEKGSERATKVTKDILSASEKLLRKVKTPEKHVKKLTPEESPKSKSLPKTPLKTSPATRNIPTRNTPLKNTLMTNTSLLRSPVKSTSPLLKASPLKTTPKRKTIFHIIHS